MDINYIGKSLIVFGFIIIGIGLLLVFSNKIPLLGRLPGDICIQKKNFTFYFPVVTSVLLSIILSFVLWIFSRR
jgi:cell division protein FtsW (lipid II flippase)